MEKKTDLRVIKTKRNIKNTLIGLLAEKPLNKISITELAKTAEINKGTFYLHYADIYELYNELLSDFVTSIADDINCYDLFFTVPEEFVKNLMETPKKLLGIDPFKIFPPENLSHNQMLPLLIISAIKERIYATNQIPPTTENDIKLEVILSGLTVIFHHGFSEKDYPLIISTIGIMIRTVF